MSFTRETAKASAQTATYDFAKFALGGVWFRFFHPMFTDWAKNMNVWGAVAWSFLAALAVPFVLIFVLEWWKSKPPEKLKRRVKSRVQIGQGFGFSTGGKDAAPRLDLALDGDGLRDFSEEFNVAVVAGFKSATVDKHQDERISVSKGYTIASERIDINVPIQSVMASHIHEEIARAEKAFKELDATTPPKTPLKVNANLPEIWTEIVVLPKAVDAQRIRRLSDVQLFGGLILSQEIRAGRVIEVVN